MNSGRLVGDDAQPPDEYHRCAGGELQSISDGAGRRDLVYFEDTRGEGQRQLAHCSRETELLAGAMGDPLARYKRPLTGPSHQSTVSHKSVDGFASCHP